MSKIKNPLSREAWDKLKAIKPSKGRYSHVACVAYMKEVSKPDEVKSTVEGEDGHFKFDDTPKKYEPYIQVVDGTKDWGINAAKRLAKKMVADLPRNATKQEKRAKVQEGRKMVAMVKNGPDIDWDSIPEEGAEFMKQVLDNSATGEQA